MFYFIGFILLLVILSKVARLDKFHWLLQKRREMVEELREEKAKYEALLKMKRALEDKEEELPDNMKRYDSDVYKN